MVSSLGKVLLLGAQKGSCMQEHLLTPADGFVICICS